MSQSINLLALRWAYEQDGLSVTAKAVLCDFAMHANEHGYSWPGVDTIASTWGMDRKTVRRQIEALLVRRMICHTKMRRGSTGQVKVYRLPKVTYESGGKCTPFKKEQRVPKESLKRGISGAPRDPNKEEGNKEQGRKNTFSSKTGTAWGNSLADRDIHMSIGKRFGVCSVPAKWHEFIRHAYPDFKGDYRHAPEYMRSDFAKARKKPAVSIGARFGVS